MKKKVYMFVILILLSCGRDNPYPNKISDFRTELQIELNELAKDKNLLSRDPIANNYLKDNCSKEELLKLLKCEIPSLRVFAYTTIIIRNEKDYFKILLGHLSDTAKVYWSSRCMTGESMVSDLLIEEVSRKLTKNEKKILVDSVLLKHSYLDYSNYMIQEVEPNESYYPLIKERTKKKHKMICGIQLGACFALSKFNKKEDLEYLNTIFQNLECSFWIFKSIEHNPNKIFYPILQRYFSEVIKNKKISSENEFKYYCRAVASYKSEKSLSILTELLNESYCPESWNYEHYREDIFRAIYKYNNPLYKDLCSKLKPKMSKFVIDYLDKPDYSEVKTW